MAGFSNAMAQNVINHFFRGQAVSTIANRYLALCVADPTDVTTTALNTEISAAWYGRQSITFDAPVDGTDVTTANSNTITFDAVTGSAVTVTHWAIFDASSSGTLMASGAFSSSKVMNVNDVFKVNGGDLVLSFD
jgi:hypothetical protein